MINTPTIDIPLPADIQKQYDNAKNAVTLAEAEVVRLRDLRISEEVTIVEKNKQKIYAEEQLNAVLTKLAFSEAELKKNEALITSQRAEIKLMRAEKEDLAISLTDRENACKMKELDIKEQEYALNTRGKELNERTILLENKESEVKEKENNIKNFVASL